MSVIHPDEIKRLSALSILNEKGTDLFTFHVVTCNGELTAQQTRVLADISEEWGSGVLSFGAQSSIAVYGIPYERIDTVLSLLEQADLMTGGTGSRIHPIVACRGTVCRFGLCDTLSLHRKMHRQLYLKYHRTALPHKLKIAIGGCPNNCVKPNLSDIGIIGQAIPSVDPSVCRGCTACSTQSVCPGNAVAMLNGTAHIDPALCIRCGRCAGKCPFRAVSIARQGIAVCIGGRSGKKTSLGQPLCKLFSSEEDALAVVERAICLYREQGHTGERFADTVDRLGFEQVQRQLLSDENET